MDSELNFEWPDRDHELFDADADQVHSPLPPIAEVEERAPNRDERDLERQLGEARATIAQLEADRRAARTRINELEAAHGTCQARLTAQRRRLLVLERQLEGVVGASLAPEGTPSRASWRDRLLGGPPPVPTV